MGRLSQWLSDASHSGVYRTASANGVEAAARDGALRVARIDLGGTSGKDAQIGRIGAALSFPAWFGGNWDALEDCLSDLSWSDAGGHVLLFEGAGSVAADERGILIDILESAAAFWRERRRPFYAVFVNGPPALPDLDQSDKWA